ncbi:hypothetical protein L1887_05157 [Cichorium endivia]|nr:hypothetical protein L1887_05157 [Cichorium endivia]
MASTEVVYFIFFLFRLSFTLIYIHYPLPTIASSHHPFAKQKKKTKLSYHITIFPLTPNFILSIHSCFILVY